MSDDRTLLTPEQAIGLLVDGPSVHNLKPAGMLMLGCDYERDAAVEALKQADEIELGGDNCKRMRHAVAAWKGDKVSFFETDPSRVESFERALETAS